MLRFECGQFLCRFLPSVGQSKRIVPEVYQDHGYIFLQIGINNAPCSGNCKFCSMGADHYALETWEQPIDRILHSVKSAVAQQVDAIFLMTTADFALEAYLDIARR